MLGSASPNAAINITNNHTCRVQCCRFRQGGSKCNNPAAAAAFYLASNLIKNPQELMFEGTITAGILHNVPAATLAPSKICSQSVILFSWFVLELWSKLDSPFFSPPSFKSDFYLISRENMIAALSINQYQIKCSKEIIESALSPFLRPQKIKKNNICLPSSLKSYLNKINK